MSIQKLLKEKLNDVFSKNIHIAPDIPERKLNNAINKIAHDIDIASIVALYDNSLFSDGKEGIVFSGTRLAYREMLSASKVIEYEKIKSAEFIEKENIIEKSNGSIKKEIIKKIEINLIDNNIIEMKNLSNCDYEKLTNLLNEISNSDLEYTEISQIITLNEMDSEIKLSYLKIIINFAFSDDGEVDPKEYAEILSLVTKLDFTTEERIKLRAYINDKENTESNESLISLINSKCPAGNEKSIHISLVKDLINVYKKTKKDKIENCKFLMDNKSLFQIDDEQIKFAEQAIENDLALINNEISNKEIEKNIKELIAKAGAVGVPIAAVYMSGSVIGLSAAGITSGLATLGMGGVLGFSGMVSGIGIAAFLGIGAYKGIKQFTGSQEIEQQKRREFLLQGVIKHTQKTINILIEDVNYISERLMKAIEGGESQSLQIKKLTKALMLLSSTGSTLTEMVEDTETKALRTKCPKELDENRLKSLTNEPSSNKYYQAVISCYEESKVETENGVTKIIFKLKNNLSVKTVKTLVDILEAIGYFSMASIAQGAAKELGKKGIEIIGNLFNEKK